MLCPNTCFVPKIFNLCLVRLSGRFVSISVRSSQTRAEDGKKEKMESMKENRNEHTKKKTKTKMKIKKRSRRKKKERKNLRNTALRARRRRALARVSITTTRKKPTPASSRRRRRRCVEGSAGGRGELEQVAPPTDQYPHQHWRHHLHLARSWLSPYHTVPGCTGFYWVVSGWCLGFGSTGVGRGVWHRVFLPTGTRVFIFGDPEPGWCVGLSCGWLLRGFIGFTYRLLE